MRTLIVYDSWFNNTRQIAEAIADGLGNNAEVIKADNDPIRYLRDCDLMIVGSPTHGGVATPDMQEFLGRIKADSLNGIMVAAFDTRVTYRWLKVIGFAAKRMARLLEKKGGKLIAEPQGFYVHDKEGPLVDGEIERARQWAATVASKTQETASMSK